MPTRAGWLVALGAVASVAGGRLFGVAELYVLGAIAIVLVVLAVAWVRRPIGRLEVDRVVRPARITVGSGGRVEVAVANRGRRATPFLSVIEPVEGTVGVRLPLGPVPAGARSDVGYRLPTRRRGLLHLGPLRVEAGDPFGLARRTVATVGARAVTVLPWVDLGVTAPLGGGRSEPLVGANHRSMSTNGAEDLATLRPYIVGDDLRRVHWPSSARAGELQVRRDEDRWQGRCTVVLDTRAEVLDPADFERAVSAAAGLIWSLSESGDQVRLWTTDGTDSAMVDARRALPALFDRLALVEQGSRSADLPRAPTARSEVAVVVSSPRAGSELAAALASSGYTVEGWR